MGNRGVIIGSFYKWLENRNISSNPEVKITSFLPLFFGDVLLFQLLCKTKDLSIFTMLCKNKGIVCMVIFVNII